MANIETLLADTRYFVETAAPGTPASGGYVIYAKTDGKLYGKNDAGTEVEFGAAGAGIAATIFAAKGDVLTATANDTPAVLTVGANGTVLTAASGQATGLQWSAPAAAPSAAAVTATIATDEALANVSYVDLATPGPAVTLTVNTIALVIVQCRCYSSSASWYARMSFVVSGANTLAASAVRACGLGGGIFDGISSRQILLTGLTPGSTTFTAKYASPAGTPHFMDRDITVIPLN